MQITQAIDSNFESVQRYACRAIYRLAAHSEIQSLCIDAGIVPALNKLSYSPSALVRKFAVMSLCNISVHESNQEKLAHLGSLPALIHLLNDQEEIVARYAAMSLTNLSTEGKNQVYIAKNWINAPACFDCVSNFTKSPFLFRT